MYIICQDVSMSQCLDFSISQCLDFSMSRFLLSTYLFSLLSILSSQSSPLFLIQLNKFHPPTMLVLRLHCISLSTGLNLSSFRQSILHVSMSQCLDVSMSRCFNVSISPLDLSLFSLLNSLLSILVSLSNPA